jgi:hypothetical protein
LIECENQRSIMHNREWQNKEMPSYD